MFSWLRSASFVCRRSKFRLRHELGTTLSSTWLDNWFTLWVDWSLVQSRMFPIRLDTAVEGLAWDTFLSLAHSRLLHVQRLEGAHPPTTLDDTWNIEQRVMTFSQPYIQIDWLQLLGSSTWYDNYYLYCGSEVQFLAGLWPMIKSKLKNTEEDYRNPPSPGHCLGNPSLSRGIFAVSGLTVLSFYVCRKFISFIYFVFHACSVHVMFQVFAVIRCTFLFRRLFSFIRPD